MARIGIPRPDQTSDRARRTLEHLQSAFGTIPNIFAAMALSPNLLDGVLRIDGATTSELPAAYRELAYIRTSAINGCEY